MIDDDTSRIIIIIHHHRRPLLLLHNYTIAPYVIIKLLKITPILRKVIFRPEIARTTTALCTKRYFYAL